MVLIQLSCMNEKLLTSSKPSVFTLFCNQTHTRAQKSPARAAILAKLIEADASFLGSHLAGDGLDVAHPARPAGLAVTVVAGAVL